MRIMVEVQVNRDEDSRSEPTLDALREYFTSLCGEGENPHVLNTGAEIIMECLDVKEVPET